MILEQGRNTSTKKISKQVQLYKETKLYTSIQKRDILLTKDFEIHPAVGDTFIVYHKNKYGGCGIKHILQDGESIWQLLKVYQFYFKMIDESNIILVQLKPYSTDVQIKTWNIQNYKESTFIHKRLMNSIFDKFYVFSQTKKVCIQENLKIKKGNKQFIYKVLTYYQFPFEENSKPINSYIFQIENKQNISVFQVNNKSKLVYVELIEKIDKKLSLSPIIVDVKYRVCDQNGCMIRKCPHVQATDTQVYIPEKIVETKKQIFHYFHIRFVIKSKRFKQENFMQQSYQIKPQKYPSNIFYLRDKYGNQPFYQIQWLQDSNQPDGYHQMHPFNNGDNIQFINSIRRQKFSQFKSRPLKIDFYDPDDLKKIGEQIQMEEYNKFQISQFNPKIYFDYSFEQDQANNKINLNIKITEIKSYIAPQTNIQLFRDKKIGVSFLQPNN